MGNFAVVLREGTCPRLFPFWRSTTAIMLSCSSGCVVVSRNWLNRFLTRVLSGSEGTAAGGGGGAVAGGGAPFSGVTGRPGTAGVGSETSICINSTQMLHCALQGPLSV